MSIFIVAPTQTRTPDTLIKSQTDLSNPHMKKGLKCQISHVTQIDNIWKYYRYVNASYLSTAPLPK